MTRARTALLTAALLFAPAALSADTSPADMVKYRQAVMGSVGKHMKATSLILKGKVDRKEDVIEHARAMHKVADDLAELFPEGTDVEAAPKTMALDKIWSKPDAFKKAILAYETSTKQLVDAATEGDMDKMVEAWGAVGESCGGCHDDFQKEDE